MDKAYQFGKRKTIAKKVDLHTFKVETIEKPIEQIGLIQGLIPASKLEWYIATALWRLKLSFLYQYPLNGGRFLRGGIVLDFYVYTTPLPTPLFAHGDYWHPGGESSSKNTLLIERVKSILKGRAADPKIIWEHEALDADMAYETVKMRLT